MDPNAAEQLLQGSTASVAFIWPPRFSLLESVKSPATSTHAIAICDDELQRLSRTAEKARSALEDSARHIAAVHNRYSLVGILPDDILFLVFHMCSSLGSTREQLRTVLALSQVCSYWRSLSLAYPILWSRIDLSNTPERLAWLFCARSRNCPLTITWPLSIYSTLRRDFASALCKQNLSRMSQLSLAATRDQLMPWLCDGVAPNAQKVFLQDADAFAYSPLILHRPLFGGNTPHLRHLSLVGIRMPWSAGVYRNLITLEIMRCNIGPYGPNDLDIRHVFRDSPLLEDLHLSFSTPFGYKVEQDALLSTQSSLVEEGRMPLRALRKLKLDLPITYVAHILQSIALPPVLSELSLCLDSPQSHISLLTDILHPSLLPAETLTTIDRLRVCDCTSFGGIQVRGYAPGADAEDRPRWEYAWKHRSRLPRELLGRIARALHTQYRMRSIPTVQLVAENGYCNNTDDVLSLLAQTPHMTALHTLSWSPNILCGMRDACEAGTLWPRLRELRVVLCGFEPDINAVLDALVGLCWASGGIRTVDITLRMTPLHDAEMRAVKEAVQSIHTKGVTVSCRRVNPSHGVFVPEEEFVATECNVSKLACWR